MTVTFTNRDTSVDKTCNLGIQLCFGNEVGLLKKGKDSQRELFLFYFIFSFTFQVVSFHDR